MIIGFRIVVTSWETGDRLGRSMRWFYAVMEMCILMWVVVTLVYASLEISLSFNTTLFYVYMLCFNIIETKWLYLYVKLVKIWWLCIHRHWSAVLLCRISFHPWENKRSDEQEIVLLINNDILTNYVNTTDSLNTLNIWILLGAALGHELTSTGTLVYTPLLLGFLDRKFERGFSTKYQEKRWEKLFEGQECQPIGCDWTRILDLRRIKTKN